MIEDEIIREVRAIRAAYAERFGFDIRALYLDAKERETKSHRLAVDLEPRLVKEQPGQRRGPERSRPKSRG